MFQHPQTKMCPGGKMFQYPQIVYYLASKMLFLRVLLPLTWRIGSSFGETSEIIFRKYVVKQSLNNLKSSKKYELLWPHTFVFALQ